jgi:hypothetical protein
VGPNLNLPIQTSGLNKGYTILPIAVFWSVFIPLRYVIITLAATYKSADSVIITYRNGIKTDQKTAIGNIVYPLLSPDVWIGKFKFGPTERSFDGKIDEVRIWNVARTQTQIQGYMNQSLSGNEPGLIGYWRFDEGTGTTVIDASGQGNNGTISSAPL